MTLLDRYASISHVGSYIQACTQETCKCWDRKVDRKMCGNPPAKLRMHSVTVLHVQSHAWYMEWTRYGNASPPRTTSQPHWHLCAAVLAHGWRLYYANDAGSYNTTALVAAPNCMHWQHAVQCQTHMLNVLARHRRSRWYLKLIYGMSIVFQGPILSDSATALILESNMMASQRQRRHDRPSLRLKSTAKSFLQAPGTVCIFDDGRRKVDRRATSADRIS